MRNFEGVIHYRNNPRHPLGTPTGTSPCISKSTNLFKAVAERITPQPYLVALTP